MARRGVVVCDSDEEKCKAAGNLTLAITAIPYVMRTEPTFVQTGGEATTLAAYDFKPWTYFKEADLLKMAEGDSGKLLVNLMPRARHDLWLQCLRDACGDLEVKKYDRIKLPTEDLGWESTPFWDALHVDAHQTTPQPGESFAAIPLTPAEASLLLNRSPPANPDQRFTQRRYRSKGLIVQERWLIGLKGFSTSYRLSQASWITELMNKVGLVSDATLMKERSAATIDVYSPAFAWLLSPEALAISRRGGSSLADQQLPFSGTLSMTEK